MNTLILITRYGEFTFIFLFSIFFFCHFVNFDFPDYLFILANPNPLGRTVSWLSCVFHVLSAGEHVSVGKKF